MDLSTEEQIIVAVRRITQAVDLWSRELWKQCGLTSPQLAVLREVVRGVHVTPTSIAVALHLTQPTVTGIMQRLERAGRIARERSQVDRRSVAARATPHGESIVESAPPLLRDQFRQRLARLPVKQRQALLVDVQLLAAMLGAPNDSDAPFLFHDKAAANGKSGSPGRTRGTPRNQSRGAQSKARGRRTAVR